MTDFLPIKERIKFYHKRALNLLAKARTVRDKDYLDGQLELAQQLLAEILQIEGGSDMVDIDELVVRTVKLSDIKMRRPGSQRAETVMALKAKLDQLIAAAKKKGEEAPLGLEIDTKRISYGNLNNLVSDMKNGKVEGFVLDKEYGVSKQGSSLFFVKRA